MDSKKIGILGIILVLAALVTSQVTGNKTKMDPASADTGSSCNTTDVVKAAVQEWGFDLNDVSIGSIDASLPGASSNRSGAFSHKPLLSESDLREFLASDDDRAVETRLLLGNMDDVTWTPVQTLVPVVHPEMKIFVNGTSVSAKSVTIPQGDVLWAGVRDCKIVSLVRGACGNMVVEHPVPVYTYSREYRDRDRDHPNHGCKHNCGHGDDKCDKVALPDKRYEYDDSRHCSYHKKDQSEDKEQNNSPQDDEPQDNDDKDTKPAENHGDGNSSHDSGGGKDSAPEGGDSDGGGGTHADNDSEDSGQGGDNDGSDSGSVTNPD
jgi:hypothetical protein